MMDHVGFMNSWQVLLFYASLFVKIVKSAQTGLGDVG